MVYQQDWSDADGLVVIRPGWWETCPLCHGAGTITAATAEADDSAARKDRVLYTLQEHSKWD
jgi:hypothetical protein